MPVSIDVAEGAEHLGEAASDDRRRRQRSLDHGGILQPLAVSSATTRASGAIVPLARRRSMAANGAAEAASGQILPWRPP